jgi:UrcA family protein
MPKKIKFSHLVLAGVGACAMLVAPTAFAKDNDDIVVNAPYTVHHGRDGREVRVSRVVSTSDLDLRYDSDVQVLHQRISATARIACDEAEDVMPFSATTDRECVRNAVHGARSKVRAVIEAARV